MCVCVYFLWIGLAAASITHYGGRAYDGSILRVLLNLTQNAPRIVAMVDARIKPPMHTNPHFTRAFNPLTNLYIR